MIERKQEDTIYDPTILETQSNLPDTTNLQREELAKEIKRGAARRYEVKRATTLFTLLSENDIDTTNFLVAVQRIGEEQPLVITRLSYKVGVGDVVFVVPKVIGG